MIMKTIKIFAAMMASVLAVSCVQKDEIVPQVGSVKVEMSFDLNAPETKVAFGNQEEPQLEWTGTETMALIFGKYGEGGADNKVITTLPSTSKGVFAGTVTVPEGFEITDLQGFVVPAENEPWFDWRSATEGRIKMNCPAEQTQAKSGEPNWVYSPFFYDLSGTITDASQTSFTFSGLTVMSAADMVKFNIYGKHPEMAADEVLESITVLNMQNTCTGTAEYILRSGSTTYNNNGATTAPVVTLTEKLTIADKTAENGIEVFMSVIGKSNRKFNQITVVTNKATYVKEIDAQTISGKKVNTFNVYQAGVNLANGFVRMTDVVLYSVDGGNTWAKEIPETFTRLAVKNQITAEDLAAIKAEIAAQSAPVDLDLSATQYESVDFPTLFAGTEDAPNTTLKSISFPGNVTNITAKAFMYCSALESVNFDGINKICDHAFSFSGLKTLRLENTLRTLDGTDHFSDCYNLTDVYFNVPRSGMSTSANVAPFRWGTRGLDKTNDLKVTVGPDSTVPRYCFCDNTNLAVLILEYNGADDVQIGNNAFNRTKNLHTVICKGTQGLLWAGIGTGYSVGSLHEDAKYLVIPDGCEDLYKAETHISSDVPRNLHHQFCNLYGFNLITQSAYDAMLEE